MTDQADKPKRCVVCDGRGYFRCDCWPGDCICGHDYEDCVECAGHGFLFPEDDLDWIPEDDTRLEGGDA